MWSHPIGSGPSFQNTGEAQRWTFSCPQRRGERSKGWVIAFWVKTVFYVSPVARSVALGHCWDARVWEALWTWESPLYWAKVVAFSFRWASRQTQGLNWNIFPVTYLLISIIFPVTIKLEIFFYKGGIFFEGRTAAGWSKGGFKNWREQNQVEATRMYERCLSMVDVWKMTAAANTISLNLQGGQLQS